MTSQALAYETVDAEPLFVTALDPEDPAGEAIRPEPARHVLVIGGAGYVGCVLTGALLAQGYRVRILDNFLYDHFHVAEGLVSRPRTSLLVGDLRDRGALDQALAGVTDVVLLASVVGDPISRKYPDLARSVNLHGSRALFDAVAGRGLRRFVFTSTCSNYGLWEGEEPATETAPLTPLSIYAETKVAFEKLLLSYCLKYRLSALSAGYYSAC